VYFSLGENFVLFLSLFSLSLVILRSLPTAVHESRTVLELLFRCRDIITKLVYFLAWEGF